MKPAKIIVYGKHPDILQTVVRLINANEAWQGEGFTEEEEVIQQIAHHPYDLLLLGGGIPQSSENSIRKTVGSRFPDLSIIQHFGGGSGLLSSEIQAALADDGSENFTVARNSVDH